MTKKKKEDGFTVIELLATIAILAIIVSVSIFVGITVMDTSKEKSYKVTINNIENVADGYYIENSDKLFFVGKNDVDTNSEYNCILVGELIENGYFKDDVLNSDVSSDRKVSLYDYIYVERDITSKVITKTEYMFSDNSLLCDKFINASGLVDISYTPIDWSLEKEVTIRYRIKDFYDKKNYKFEYDYENNEYSYGDGIVELISDDGDIKKLRVTDNMKIIGKYYELANGGDEISGSKDIINIDKTIPTIKIDKTSDDEAIVERNINVTIEDDKSGLKTGGVLEYGWSENNQVEPEYEKANLDYQDGDKSVTYTISKTGLMGTYYLWIKVNISDVLGNNLTYDNVYGGYEFVYMFEVTIDYDDGISEVTGLGMYIVGDEVTVSANPKEFYKFNGWSGFGTSGDQIYTFTMPDYDVDLKVSSLAYKCNSGELTNDESRGYICVVKATVTEKVCYNCDCINYIDPYSCRVCYCDCLSGAEFCGCCGPGTCGGYCASYGNSVSYSYSCKTGWSKYSGSESTLKCYKKATN